MEVTPTMFYLMSAIVVAFSVLVIVLPNPIYSALSLAGSMVGLAFVFFLLEAYFIAAVQLIVYAGAVMVLFVMVLMLFDLKKEVQAFSKGIVQGLQTEYDSRQNKRQQEGPRPPSYARTPQYKTYSF